MNVFACQASHEHEVLSVPTWAGTIEPGAMPVDISVDLWGLMTDKCAPSLSFPKRLNTLGDPNTHYLPGEHCFEVQKMTIKVSDDGDTQNQGTWHLKGHLGMDNLRERGGWSLAFKREGRRNSGWGRSWFGRVWSLRHLGGFLQGTGYKITNAKLGTRSWGVLLL